MISNQLFLSWTLFLEFVLMNNQILYISKNCYNSPKFLQPKKTKDDEKTNQVVRLSIFDYYFVEPKCIR